MEKGSMEFIERMLSEYIRIHKCYPNLIMMHPSTYNKVKEEIHNIFSKHKISKKCIGIDMEIRIDIEKNKIIMK